MTTITFDDDQLRQILSAELPIELFDRQGRFLGRIEKFHDEADEIRRRLGILPSTDTGN